MPLFFFLLTSFCYAQQKGASPIPSLIDNSTGTVRAVVIGISDYQDEKIPDLQFAHQDAQLFADWLASSKGGFISSNNIRLLTNEEATMGKIVAELGWLIDESKEGDVSIIYFSGHGDVENKILDDPGYLLVWDSPARSYMLNGFSIDHLKRVIKTISVVNKAKVLLITDACRSGQLAGNEINGTGITNQNLSVQFANEVKILSCQPNEYSYEGTQWGGGHGAFTYHLAEGLYGLADRNSDLQVTLSEIDRYLEDHVSKEVSPNKQFPMVVGDKTELVTYVNMKAMDERENTKTFKIESFSPLVNRGWEEEILASADTSIARKFELFKLALSDKQFFEPANICAEDLYQELISIPELEPLHNQMRRNYAAALQDDAQQAMNRMIFKPELEMDIWFSPAQVQAHYGPQPKKLERADELLGSDHYMHQILQARKELFEGGILYFNCNEWKNLISGPEAIQHFRNSLRWQPKAPHTYLWMAMAYFYNLQAPDSADHYINLAIESAPTWNLPKYMQSIFYSVSGRTPKAKILLDNLMEVGDTTDGSLWYSWMYYYYYQGELEKSDQANIKAVIYSPDSKFFKINRILNLGFLGKKIEALKLFENVIQLDSTYGYPYYFIGNMYYYVQEPQNAIPYFKMALAKDPSMTWAYSHLGDAYLQLDSLAEAEAVLELGYEKDSTYMPLINAMGGLYAGKKDHQKARYFFEKAIEMDSSKWQPHYNLIHSYVALGDFEKAIENLKLAFEKGMLDYLNNYLKQGYEFFGNDKEIDPLKELPGYKELMKKYFPDQFKD